MAPHTKTYVRFVKMSATGQCEDVGRALLIGANSSIQACATLCDKDSVSVVLGLIAGIPIWLELFADSFEGESLYSSLVSSPTARSAAS